MTVEETGSTGPARETLRRGGAAVGVVAAVAGLWLPQVRNTAAPFKPVLAMPGTEAGLHGAEPLLLAAVVAAGLALLVPVRRTAVAAGAALVGGATLAVAADRAATCVGARFCGVDAGLVLLGVGGLALCLTGVDGSIAWSRPEEDGVGGATRAE